MLVCPCLCGPFIGNIYVKVFFLNIDYFAHSKIVPNIPALI